MKPVSKSDMTRRGIESLPPHAFVMSDTRQLWNAGHSPTMALGLEENDGETLRFCRTSRARFVGGHFPQLIVAEFAGLQGEQQIGRQSVFSALAASDHCGPCHGWDPVPLPPLGNPHSIGADIGRHGFAGIAPEFDDLLERCDF